MNGCSFQTLCSVIAAEMLSFSNAVPLNNTNSPCCQLTVYRVQYSVKSERWFLSNVVSLNNVDSPYPPAPFPEGEGGVCRALRALHLPWGYAPNPVGGL